MFRRLLAPGLFVAASLLGGVTRAQNVNLPPLPAANPALPGQETFSLVFPPNADVKEILAYYERLTQRRLIYDAQVTGPVPLVINTPVTGRSEPEEKVAAAAKAAMPAPIGNLIEFSVPIRRRRSRSRCPVFRLW